MDRNKIDYLIEKKLLIVISGPTASGKTQTAIDLAKFLPIEIISADSRQIFKHLDIGTAKPTALEQSQAKHHFIDFLELDEYYSAGVFAKQAIATITSLFLQKIIPIIAGGSGLYIKALCEGLFQTEEHPERQKIRDYLTKKFDNEGIDNIFAELKAVDLPSALKYIDQNPRRVLRALEHFYLFKEPFSEAIKQNLPREIENIVYFYIDLPRKMLYEKINLRAELMWQGGLLEETEKVLSMGYSSKLNALNTVGYKEAIAFLNNEMNADEALEKMKQNTRRYAKRQATWFNNQQTSIIIDPTSENPAEAIVQYLEKINI